MEPRTREGKRCLNNKLAAISDCDLTAACTFGIRKRKSQQVISFFQVGSVLTKIAAFSCPCSIEISSLTNASPDFC